jgi:hypothetical protein
MVNETIVGVQNKADSGARYLAHGISEPCEWLKQSAEVSNICPLTIIDEQSSKTCVVPLLWSVLELFILDILMDEITESIPAD